MYAMPPRPGDIVAFMRAWLAIVATFAGAACGHKDASAPAAPPPSFSPPADIYHVEVFDIDAAPPPAPAEPVAAAAAPAEVAKGRVVITEKQAFDDTTLTGDDVWTKFQSAYLPAVATCYQQLLARDATARGKLRIAFTVKRTGRVDGVDVAGFDDPLDTCIKDTSPGWAFVRPTDKDGHPTDASFRFTLQLVPG
jgi:hypothetical protein